MNRRINRLLFALIACYFLGACGDIFELADESEDEKQQLTIFAAASLAEAFVQVGEAFEAVHPNVEVVISFAGSQQIAQQLSQGAPGDLFASADAKQMENVINSGRVSKDTIREFVHNQLVLILPGGNPGDIDTFGDLAKPGLDLIVADSSVPVGAYSQQLLERADQHSDFGSGYKSSVLGNVVSYEENVRAVLTKILLGEADAGLVYVSDASGVPEEELITVQIPDEINITASYYIAPLEDSSNRQLAQDFISLVLSTQGQEILADFGFVMLSQNE